jgi:apolipoprotein N-acyltransferase
VVVPSLAAGLLLAASLPPWGLWVLAPVGAALLWWRLAGLRARARLLAGWLCGLGLFVPGLFWVTSFNWYGGVLLMLVEALALGLAALITPPGRGRSAGLVGAMVLAEAARAAWPFGGLPLGGVALGQAGGPLLGAARLGGPLIVVGLVWASGVGLGLAVRALVGALRRRGRPRAVPVALGVGVLAVVVAVAWWGAAAPDGGTALSTLRAAAVQGGGPRGLRASEADAVRVYEAQLHASGTIPAVDGGQAPSLVLWPEDVVSLSVPLSQDPAVRRQLSALAVRLHATLVVGITTDVSARAFRNQAVAFGPDGRIVDTYEKVHRVPFGEYVPWRGLIRHLADLSAVPRDAIAGTGDGVLHTPAGALGTMVSYEVFFSARGRVAVRNGAELLIVPTNTSSYSTGQVPAQEVAAARLQSVAQGRDLVQAAPTGYSAVIDHRGHVLLRSSLGSRAVLVADVALRSGQTLYVRFGDLPALVVAGALVLGAWLAALLTPDRRRGAEARRRTARRRQAQGDAALDYGRTVRRPSYELDQLHSHHQP